MGQKNLLKGVKKDKTHLEWKGVSLTTVKMNFLSNGHNSHFITPSERTPDSYF